MDIAVLVRQVMLRIPVHFHKARKGVFMTFTSLKRNPWISTVAMSGAVVAMAAMAATGAHAQSSPWSLGAAIGQSDARMPNSIGNSSDTSYKAFGGYQFSPNVGAEVGYNNLGKDFNMTVPGGVATGKLTNWYGAAVGTMPLGSGFSLLGKVGLTRNEADFGGAGKDTRTGLMLGLGAEYAITPALSARLEYEDYGKFTDGGFAGNSGAIKADSINLGLRAKF